MKEKSFKKIFLSFIILAFNEEKNIKKLLNKLKKLALKDSEILIIDSGSTDKTSFIIKQYQKKIKNLYFFQIEKDKFDFGKTRNFAIKKSRGKYICFISADAYPLFNNKIIQYIKEDFNIDKKVVCVYGKQIPYSNHNILYQIEISCLSNLLDGIIKKNKQKILLQKKDLSYKQNKILYFLSNVFAIYKKSFLLKFPFEKGGFEDIKMGKLIIDKELIKIYDPRLKVKHSHNFTIREYLKRQYEEYITLKKLKIKSLKVNILCKIKSIIKTKIYFKNKIFLITRLFYIYLLKLIVLIKTKYYKD